VRRIVKGAVVLGLAGGLAAVVMLRPKPVMDVWNKVRHHAPSSPSEAWVAVRHHASDAWIAIRRHTPFGSPQAERSASVAAATTAVADRDATESRSTSRRTKKRRSRSE
jgi:hypothetical protein